MTARDEGVTHRRICWHCGQDNSHDVDKKPHGGVEFQCRDCGGRVMYK